MTERPEIEQLRWTRHNYKFETVEQYERETKKKWVTPTTRNHGAWEDGICRDVRTDTDRLRIDDDKTETVASLLVGRTIVRFEREPDSDEEWSFGDNSVTLTLDDGAQLLFVGWGYDASGLDTTYKVPDV